MSDIERYELHDGLMYPLSVGAWVKWEDVEDLQKIVDRLPKTADGMPITQGSVVWFCQPNSTQPVGVPAHLLRPRVGCVEVDWGECYSTREAAENAAKEKKTT